MRFIVFFLFSALCTAHAVESAGMSRLRESLGKAEQEHGKEAPEVAARLSELASHLEAADSFQEAEALYRRALAIREKVSGVIPGDLESSLNNLPHRPALIARLTSLGNLLRAQQRDSEAEPVFKRIRLIRENTRINGPPPAPAGARKIPAAQ